MIGYRAWIFWINFLVVAGCTDDQPVEHAAGGVAVDQDPCAAAGQYEFISPAIDKMTAVRFANYRQTSPREVALPGSGWLCLSIMRDDSSAGWADVRVNQMSVFSPAAMSGDIQQVMRAVPVQGDVQVQLEGYRGEFSLAIGFVPDSTLFSSTAASSTTAPSESNIPAQVACNGRLISLRHPFGLTRPGWPGLDEQRYPDGRRPVARANVAVYCAVVLDQRIGAVPSFAIARRDSAGHLADLDVLDLGNLLNPGESQIPPGTGQIDPFTPHKAFYARGQTDVNGEFRLTIDIPAEYRHLPLIRRYADCRDNHASCSQQNIGTLDASVPTDIWDVADLSFSTSPTAADGPLEAFLLTNAGSEPTELPVSRLPELGTEQPDPVILGDDVRSDAQSTAGVSAVAMVAQPPAMNDLPLVIHEPFDPLDEDSFDYLVWLLGGQPIDFSNNATNDLCTVPPQALCMGAADCGWTPSCSASSSPVQCRAVNVLKVLLDAGYDVWLVDHGRKSSVARAAPWGPILYQSILRLPQSDDRNNLAVAGLSSGALVARMGLLLWQREQDLAELNRTNGTNLFIHQSGFLTMPFSRVAAYFSFDAPHLGARIPVSIQAYLNDDAFPITSELTSLLRADATRELLVNYVDSEVDTDCFANRLADQTPRGCKVRPQDVDTGLVSDTGVTNLLALSREVLDQPTPGRVGADGLPNGLPSFGIANSRREGAGITHDTDSVLQVTINKEGFDHVQTLRDDRRQPPGSLYPNLCRAHTLGKSTDQRVDAFAATVDDCDAATGAGLFCLLATPLGVLNQFKATLFGDGQADPVTIDVKVPMRYPSFISAESALLAPGANPERGTFAPGWNDALWAIDEELLHFDVTDEACKFIRYHLDGVMLDDRDGKPACRHDMTATCDAGGMSPGPLIAPNNQFVANPTRYCE